MASFHARASTPRIYPAGRAAAIFAVCEPELAGRRLNVGGRRVVALAIDRFALLLNYVDRSAYTPGELALHRDDAPWQASEARVYEGSIERASRHGAVLPMPPLTIVNDASNLDAYVREHTLRWGRSLARLGKQRECAVHLFAGPHASLSTSVPYSIRVTRRVLRSGRVPQVEGAPAVTAFARDFWQTCASLAVAVTLLGICCASVGGRGNGVAGRRGGPETRRGALWSAALLLDEGGIDKLGSVLERTVAGASPLGVSVYLEGPRPPFSFA